MWQYEWTSGPVISYILTCRRNLRNRDFERQFENLPGAILLESPAYSLTNLRGGKVTISAAYLVLLLSFIFVNLLTTLIFAPTMTAMLRCFTVTMAAHLTIRVSDPRHVALVFLKTRLSLFHILLTNTTIVIRKKPSPLPLCPVVS